MGSLPPQPARLAPRPPIRRPHDAAAIIPVHTAEEAIEELEFAVKQLGYKVAMLGSLMHAHVANVVAAHVPVEAAYHVFDHAVRSALTGRSEGWEVIGGPLSS